MELLALKYVHGHADGDRPDGDVFPAIDSISSITYSFNDQINTEDEDKCSNDQHSFAEDQLSSTDDGISQHTEVGYDGRSDEHDSRSTNAEHDTGQSRPAADPINWNNQVRSHPGNRQTHIERY